jgi:nucleoside-diphosphate-sugar epimerase
LFDDASGLGPYNRLVSGSGSVPDSAATYDDITRVTAFNAIDAAVDYAERNGKQNFPFVFTSAAEAGWPEVTGGPFIERFVPDFLHRYLVAKRAVESRLLNSDETKNLRPVIMRPSLIYSLDRPASFPAVGAFMVGNKLGLPFVDRPVSVQSVANAIVRAVSREDARGIQRYPQIDALNA